MEEAGRPAGGANPKASIFDKLDALCEEITTDIRAQSGLTSEIGSMLAKLKERAFLDRSPEAQHALLLYRHYRELTKASVSSSSSVTSGGGSGNDDFEGLPTWLSSKTIPRLPDFVLEPQAEQLVGVAATKKNIFWLRSGTVLLSMISFSIFSSAPFIHFAHPTLNTMFLSSCVYAHQQIGGSFDFTSFQCALAVAILIFIHSVLWVAYYVLPVDANGHKHVPLLEKLFEPCSIDANEVNRHSSRVSLFCRVYSKLIECVVDAGLLFMNLIVVVIASIQVEQGRKFDFGAGVEYFFTLGTFWQTFEATSPECVVKDDPTQKIRAALAMLYLCLFVQVLTLLVSLRSYGKEVVLRSGVPLSSSIDDRQGVKRSLVRNADPDDEEGVVEVSL